MTRAPLAIAACAATALAVAVPVAVAPCYFELPAAEAGGLVEVQVTPAGRFKPRDGRKLPVDAWRIDAAIAARVIERFRALQTPLVVDYEHQTLQAEDNGQPAPAAGFIRALEWREGSGLWARVEFTARARQYLADGEYRYFSPVVTYDTRSGEITSLLMGALTNNPALDGMAPIEARAAARFHLTPESEMNNKLLLAVCTALAIKHEGREAADVEADAIAALAGLKDAPDPLAAVRKELGLAETVAADEVVAACRSTKAKADAAAEPDPAKYVGIEVVKQLRDQVAALSATQTAREIDELVKPALEDGRLLPAQEAWARSLGKSDIAALRSYLDSAQPIAALRGTQTGGRDPQQQPDENGLTPDELALCRATGVDPKAFATAKKGG